VQNEEDLEEVTDVTEISVPDLLAPASDRRPACLLARTCLLAPGVIDPAAAVHLAEEAVAAMLRCAWYLHTLALAHYRAGRYQRTVERLLESIEVDPVWRHGRTRVTSRLRRQRRRRRR
jgi:hypothetical protein